MAPRTIQAPKVNPKFKSISLNKYEEAKHDKIIDKDVAKPFITLSAYLTTTATILKNNSKINIK